MKKWIWLPVGSAVLMVLLGAMGLVWPASLLDFLPVVMGVGLIFIGAVQLVFFWADRSLSSLPGFGWLSGVATLAAGAVFVFNHNVSMAFFGVCGGVWAIVLAVLRTRAALQRRDMGVPWLAHLAGGIVYFLAGLALFLSPLQGMDLVMRLIGLVLLGAGSGLLYACHGVNRTLEAMLQPTGAPQLGQTSGDSSSQEGDNTMKREEELSK